MQMPRYPIHQSITSGGPGAYVTVRRRRSKRSKPPDRWAMVAGSSCLLRRWRMWAIDRHQRLSWARLRKSRSHARGSGRPSAGCKRHTGPRPSIQNASNRRRNTPGRGVSDQRAIAGVDRGKPAAAVGSATNATATQRRLRCDAFARIRAASHATRVYDRSTDASAASFFFFRFVFVLFTGFSTE